MTLWKGCKDWPLTLHRRGSGQKDPAMSGCGKLCKLKWWNCYFIVLIGQYLMLHILFRFSELLAYTDGQYHYRQHYHLYSWLSAAPPGKFQQPYIQYHSLLYTLFYIKFTFFFILFPTSGIHQRFLLVLLWQGHHWWTGQKKLFQGHVCSKASVQQSYRIYSGTRS